jgi:hypothetical protein
MKERPLSASSIKTYLQCLQKYYYRYIDKKPRPGKTDPLAFGIAMHEALEVLHAEVAETGESPGPELYEKVLNAFMTSATWNGLSDMNTYQEGRDLLLSRLDVVDPDEDVLGLELVFKLKTPKGTPYTGAIDKLVALDDETLVVVDYKTSRTALSQDEANTDIQFSMYDLAASELFPEYKTIVCVFDYLRLPEVVTHRTPEQRRMFVDFLDAIYAEAKRIRKDDVKPSLNAFCPWCEFKSFCPGYVKALSDPDLLLPPLGEMSDNDLVKAWVDLGSTKRIVDCHQRELKAEVYERMKDQAAIVGDEQEIFMVQQSRINYDARTVYKLAGKDAFLRMSSVSKSAVDRFLRDNPEHAEEIKEGASFSFLSPSFRTRKVKGS